MVVSVINIVKLRTLTSNDDDEGIIENKKY